VNEVQESVGALVAAQLEDGSHLGVQVVAVHHGEVIVDLAAGYLDPARTVPVQRDSLFCCFSVTKAVAAIGVWQLIEEGRLALDQPLVTVWPAMRSGAVTVAHVLTHQAGLLAVPRPLTTDFLADDRAGIDWVAASDPMWPPGTAMGYHTLTYGWLVRGLVEAVTARPYPSRLAPGVHCGLPVERAADAAYIVEFPGARGLEWITTNGHGPHPAEQAMPTAYVPPWNDPRLRHARQPAFSGWSTARALALLFAGLLTGTDGPLRPGTVDRMVAPAVEGVDRCLEVPIRRSHGFELGGRDENGSVGALGPRESAFGHGGHGGQVVMADPDAGLAIAVLVNQLPAPALAAERTTTICELIRGLLGVA
jgi:CubicO group peptidase (beta-lactamase class C family)